MANSITGINDDIILDAALEAFCAGITPLRAFSADFSPAAGRRGEKVSVLRTSAADAATTKSTATAYTIQDADSDAIEITLGQPVYVSWGLDDTEMAQSSVLSLERYGKQKGFQLAKKVLQDIWALVTNANFGAAAFTGAATTFDEDDAIDIKDAMDDNDCPDGQRSLILSNAYYNQLLKDGSLKDASAYGGAEAIRQGMVPNLVGFDVYRSNLIPANGENLVGMAVFPDAIGVAMRYLQPQEGHKYHRAEPLTDPETGITIGVRDWYDEDSGMRKRVLECVSGSAVGIANGLERMVSA
jgi:hypothetical protein